MTSPRSIWPIALVILTSVLYQLAQRAMPRGANPFALLTLVYGIGVALCCTAGVIAGGRFAAAKLLPLFSWPSWLLAASVVGIEVGYLLAYRAGWTLGSAFAVASTASTVLLALIGLCFFAETLSVRRVCGLLLALGGLWLLLAPSHSRSSTSVAAVGAATAKEGAGLR